ncbi:MAG: flagellar protein export ATPase FliI [bacterium]
MSLTSDLTNPENFRGFLGQMNLVKQTGRVVEVVGVIIESDGPVASVGEYCEIAGGSGGEVTPCEVVGFRGDRVLLMPFGEMRGICPGSEVRSFGRQLTVNVSENIIGRIVDGLGNPIDGKGPIAGGVPMSIHADAPKPLKRRRITEYLPLGIRAVDALLTCGRGQRMGIFSGSGVGKSSMLGMIARFTKADVNVIGLIGERGREVREFIERDLGEEGLSRSVVVVATSDQPSLMRIKGAFTATAIAEFFRDRGNDVILMIDSITRFAYAQREMGLARGEPPTTRGYTPSLFGVLPKLLERSGTSDKGSITGLYNVLVEADDMNEPVADAIRAILDGHVVLSRDLASRNIYPPVDVLQSVSRVMIDVVEKEQLENARRLEETLAVYRDAEDLINIGAYVKNSNPKIDYAVSKIDGINNFIRQGLFDKVEYGDSVQTLKALFAS